ncbi:hypothetical protein V6N12_008702 [Hibiscus sabdariffa]|uniref:Myb-like domain-containing protein n=1 Tax=Hibiscus sabdariffa TaxID=183260 RepID=A0ABR2AJA7_9ROSI
MGPTIEGIIPSKLAAGQTAYKTNAPAIALQRFHNAFPFFIRVALHVIIIRYVPFSPAISIFGHFCYRKNKKQKQKFNMVHKRPFVEEDAFEVSNKQSRQAEDCNLWVLSSEPLFSEALVSECSEDFKANVPGCTAIPSQGTCSVGEDNSWPEEPLHIASYGECFNPERPIRTISRLEDIYSILLQCPPRKPVLVGPNYQADIPEWEDLSVVGNNCNDSDVLETAACRYGIELMRACIIPMTDLESFAYDDKVGRGRTNCNCEDKDSVRCVRQHILERREELRESLGLERFMELGFCDMGEVVADKWSEEEEHLFHKVVFSNPVSIGRNFWKILASVFPYRTKMDIVSYYFNVFMLRKRSVQNRCESMSIDSDNDEWQGTDDSDNSEVSSEEDEDSVVESLVCQEDFPHHESRENGLCVFHEDAAAETYSGKLFSNRGSVPVAQVNANILEYEQGEHEKQEAQDDSCTSSDMGPASHSQETPLTADNGDRWQGNVNGLNSGGSHGYGSEPCDSKVWDSGYATTCQKNKIDFLPTCSMIEEVFGDGS